MRGRGGDVVCRSTRGECGIVGMCDGCAPPTQAEVFPDKNHGGRIFRNQAVMSAMGIPQVT